MNRFSLEQISSLTETPLRTVRFYIQKGLLRPPLGGRRTAYYTDEHMERLLLIKKWQRSGVSLERIRELIDGLAKVDEFPPPRERRAGDIEVWTKILVRDGIEIHIEPKLAGITPEALRRFARDVMALAYEMRGKVTDEV